MKFLKQLFGSKQEKPAKQALPAVADILSDKQQTNTALFYFKHKERIDEMVAKTDKAYEPSQAEDKNNPAIWKAEYWKWFLANS